MARRSLLNGVVAIVAILITGGMAAAAVLRDSSPGRASGVVPVQIEARDAVGAVAARVAAVAPLPTTSVVAGIRSVTGRANPAP
jgi:hypothetical protein